MRKSVFVTGCVLALAVSACADSSSGPEELTVERTGPWIAVSSAARAQNPLAWVGDEHNRIVMHARADMRVRGVRNWSRAEKCRWLAEIVLAEARSSEANPEMRRRFATGKLDGASFEAGTRRIGCLASDAPIAVNAVSSAIRATPGSAPHLEEGDTVDYVPSDEAISFNAQIESAVASSGTPSQLDGNLASIQSSASGLWDAEAVQGAASVAASSAYYWQSEGGGGASDPWVDVPPEEGCAPNCQIQSLRAGESTGANAEAGSIVGADVAGALSLWIGNGLGWRMTLSLGSKVLLSGGWGFAAATAASAAVWSIAAAM